jgi:hypothetical protein
MIRKPRLLILLAVTLLAAMLPAAAQAYLLQTRDVVFLVRVGTNSDGTPAFRVAQSTDYGAERVYKLAASSSALERTAAYYRRTQELANGSLLQQAQQYGLSASDQQLASSLLETEPIFVELKEGSGGTFNDWKGSFTVRDTRSGSPVRVSSPRVTLPLSSSVVTGGDSALLEQTLVHEVGHSIMAKGYGIRNLPDSPYISQPHSGNSVTDQQLAIIEGYAEFIGAYFTNRLTIANDPRNAITDNLYAYNTSGGAKTAAELQKTEGWVATVLYSIATRSGIQGCLEKMNVVMVRAKPQSVLQFLEAFQKMYPSDAQALRAIVARTSNGTIYGNSYSGNTAGGTTASGTPSNTLSEYESTLNSYLRLRYGYLAGTGYDEYQRWRVGQAAQQQATRLQTLEQTLRRQVLSGGNAGNSMLRLQQIGNNYQQAYTEVRRQLSAAPWYSQRDRGRLEAEAQALGEILQRHNQLVRSLESGAVSYYPTSKQNRYYPQAPVNSKDAYRGLVDALKSGDRDKANQALDVYRDTPRVPPAR